MSARKLNKLVSDTHCKGKQAELDNREGQRVCGVTCYKLINGVDAKTDSNAYDEHKDKE